MWRVCADRLAPLMPTQKTVVVVKPAFVPNGLKSGGEAYLERTWRIELEKCDIHPYIHTLCTGPSSTPASRYVCQKGM